MLKGALMCFRNNVILHAAWQNEITLSYNPISIQPIYKWCMKLQHKHNFNLVGATYKYNRKKPFPSLNANSGFKVYSTCTHVCEYQTKLDLRVPWTECEWSVETVYGP